MIKINPFLTFPAYFKIPIIFSYLNSNCSNLSDLRNLQEQVTKAFCYQRLFWPFTVWINCSSDLKKIEKSRPSASNFKSFSRSLEQFFLTVGQHNFRTKIPYLLDLLLHCCKILFSAWSIVIIWKVVLWKSKYRYFLFFHVTYAMQWQHLPYLCYKKPWPIPRGPTSAVWYSMFNTSRDVGKRTRIKR